MNTQTNAVSPGISNQQLLLLLLGLEPSGVGNKGLSGITRFQKLLFLLWKEAGLESIGSSFDFKPYKAGPYSRKLYDELEFLENIGLIQSEVEGEASDVEAAELEEVSFEQLMGDDADPFVDVPSQKSAMTADAYEERRFTLTDRGVEAVRKILESDKSKIAEESLAHAGVKSSQDFFNLVCDCQICKGVLSSSLDNLSAFGEMHKANAAATRPSQTPAAAKMCRYHFLLNRLREPALVSAMDADQRSTHISTIAAPWRHAVNLRSYLGHGDGYLERWANVLQAH